MAYIIKNILSFQLFFGNQKNPKKAVVGKKLARRIFEAAYYNMPLLLAWWTIEITKTCKNRSTTTWQADLSRESNEVTCL